MLSLARGVSHRSDGGIAANVASRRYISSENRQRLFMGKATPTKRYASLTLLDSRAYRQQRLFTRMFRWFRPRRQALGQVLRNKRVTSAGANRQRMELK